ncbi:4'-phosphopantetheine phosphatase [Acropora cervicornis]|uniref:4'-phosphopantetheine phosphatase n=1 Tax=Acropora cervicornis TaxID=6130 RepID=A0AAD9V9W5_ACRCE|nr:4'-phosphopantetheine phosphatase [Acropora cervicornis]
MDFKTNQESSSGYARSISLPEVFRNLKTAKIFAVDIGVEFEVLLHFKCERAATGHIYEIKEDQESSLRLHFIKFETKYIEMCVNFIQENILSEAYKDRALKATVDKEDEMECLIRGCNFLLRNISNEVFEFHREQKPPYVFQDLDHSELVPYLLVNIGSGVSIVKVLSETQYERVGGTSMGGGTFWGLGSLLTSAKVRDIYGGAYEALKLPGDLTASSFGKTVRSTRDDFQPNHAGQFAEADIAKSLLHMISNDIGQRQSSDNAHHLLWHQLLVEVDCTSGKLNVLTWRENYAGSSGLSSVKWPTDSMNIRIADGLNVVERAIASQPNVSDAKERAEQFRNKFRLRLDVLKKQPVAYGNLSVRSLLDVREQYLNEFNFPDPYAEVKQQENEAALLLLSERLKELDALPWEQRQCALVEGILAGNVFDWGAKEVAELMENGSLDFETSMKKVHLTTLQSYLSTTVELISYWECFHLSENCCHVALRAAYDEKRLVPMESGIGSPCLDCRAVHTNYDAKFTCESIKLAAIKNRWLAKRLGGDMYSVVFRYEQGTAP